MNTEQQPPATAQPRTAAGVLFFNHEGHVLLVKPSYKDSWDIPGGYVEPGESPLKACVREVLEELAIEPDIGRLLVVDWAPNPGEGDKILFVFDGGELSPATQTRIHLDPQELIEYAFYDPEHLDRVLSSRLERRISTAVTARHRGQLTYAEHGSVTTTTGAALPN